MKYVIAIFLAFAALGSSLAHAQDEVTATSFRFFRREQTLSFWQIHNKLLIKRDLPGEPGIGVKSKSASECYP